MPAEDLVKIQSGIAEMLANQFSAAETSEIQNALAEAEAEFSRGKSFSEGEMRRHIRLQ